MNGHARRPLLPASLMLARRRADGALPGPAPAVPGPIAHGRAGPAAPPRRLPTACGWSRPGAAGDSGGAPHERVLEVPGPARCRIFTLPAAAPGGSTHLSPAG